MGDESSVALIVVLLVIVILLDWLGSTTWFGEWTGTTPAERVIPAQQIAASSERPVPTNEGKFTSGTLDHQSLSFHYIEDAERWVYVGD